MSTAQIYPALDVVPKSITDAVIRKGIDVMTAQADGSATVSDEQLLHRATEQNRLLFTQDADFLEIAARWQTQRFYFPGTPTNTN